MHGIVVSVDISFYVGLRGVVLHIHSVDKRYRTVFKNEVFKGDVTLVVCSTDVLLCGRDSIALGDRGFVVTYLGCPQSKVS